MKGSTIALGAIKGRNAAAHIVDGRLDDFLIDGDAPAPGTIYRAKADRPIKGMGGLFVTLPDGQRGYLRGVKDVRPGDSLLVQVTGYAEAGKAIPLTARVLHKSRFVIVTPGAPGLNISRTIKDEEARVRLRDLTDQLDLPEDLGLILRTTCAEAEDDAILHDLEATVAIAVAIAADDSAAPALLLDGPGAHEKAWVEWPLPDDLDDSPEAFENHNVEDLLDAFRQSGLPLGEGLIFIEATRALVAVDVNTGRDGSLAAGQKVNFALARELPRLLRILGLGGQITLDLAPMPKKERRTFEQVLQKAFRAGGIETALAGWTPLGNYELQRKRERLPVRPLI